MRFVPKTGYSGSVSFSYTGYAADGTGYSGKVNITVGSGEGSVFYETSQMKPVKFKVADFREAFASDSDDTLYYVRFTPPDASSGKLYYGYTSASNYTSLVSAGTKYYASSNPALSSVAFVPGAGFYGTISIPYTAYGTDGSDHAGTVVVTVLESAGGTVQYDTDINMPVRLDAEDFGSSFLDQAGLSLSYVRFTLPPSSSGTLYYGYSSPTKYASKVSSSGRYYRTSSPGISDVTFVPAADYSGTVKISYTGYTSSSEEYEGVLLVNVRHPFTDVGTGYSWASAAVARLYNKGVVQGTGSALFNPAGTITRGDFMLMVYRAFDLRSGISGNFSDVPEGSYYYNAIAVAKELGIATGSGGKRW